MHHIVYKERRLRTASNNGSISEPAAMPAVGRETGPAPDQAPAERSARDACVALAMGGDRGAIRRLWEENRRWVAAVLLAHKPALEELDDLLQEVAMTLVSKIHTLREETNFRAWLRTVARSSRGFLRRSSVISAKYSNSERNSSFQSLRGTPSIWAITQMGSFAETSLTKSISRALRTFSII